MNKNTRIADKEGLEKKIEQFKEDSAKGLHVVSDFDKTLTTAFVNGEKMPSIISILRDGNYLTSDYTSKANELYDKYHPIEIDPKVPLEEKKKAMHEWWTAHFDLLIKSGLNKKDLEKVIESGKVRFREGALDFFDFLNVNDIPLVIMSSSGLGGDVIAMRLEKEGKLHDNVYIISNSYKWDENGNAVGVKEPIIHVMNKGETAIQNFPVFEVIKNKRNVMLLGDSLGDIRMIEGFDYNNLIKIGFLNENVEENLEQYKRSYDVLTLNDSSMGYVNGLLREIC